VSDENIEKKLRDEVIFWHDYIDRNLGQQDRLIPRMYEALDFAQQRLDAYVAFQSGDFDRED
jgi:hypothetical protein